MNYLELLLHLWVFGGMPMPANPPTGLPKPLTEIAPAEQDYYDQIFLYVMESVPADQQYDWKSYSVSGSLVASALFISKSGYSCRTYSETFVAQERQGMDQGVACKRRGDDGWCRLKTGSAQTCAMEPPKNSIEEILRGTKELIDSGSGKVNGAKYDMKNWQPWSNN